MNDSILDYPLHHSSQEACNYRPAIHGMELPYSNDEFFTLRIDWLCFYAYENKKWNKRVRHDFYDFLKDENLVQKLSVLWKYYVLIQHPKDRLLEPEQDFETTNPIKLIRLKDAGYYFGESGGLALIDDEPIGVNFCQSIIVDWNNPKHKPHFIKFFAYRITHFNSEELISAFLMHHFTETFKSNNDAYKDFLKSLPLLNESTNLYSTIREWGDQNLRRIREKNTSDKNTKKRKVEKRKLEGFTRNNEAINLLKTFINKSKDKITIEVATKTFRESHKQANKKDKAIIKAPTFVEFYIENGILSVYEKKNYSDYLKPCRLKKIKINKELLNVLLDYI